MSQKTGYIKGRLLNLNSNSPISFADISDKDKSLVTKSNSNGEFLLFPPEFPATLKISKIGFQEKTITFNNPDDSLLISLTPLEIQKIKYSNMTSQDYGILLKKALEKFKKYEGSDYPDPLQKKLVYCRITSSVDSTINSLFESYVRMNVNKYVLQKDQSDIARYASNEVHVTGLSQNSLDFKIDPLFNLPMFIESYITRRGFFEQNDSPIALIEIGLQEPKMHITLMLPILQLYISQAILNPKAGRKSRYPIRNGSLTEVRRPNFFFTINRKKKQLSF